MVASNNPPRNPALTGRSARTLFFTVLLAMPAAGGLCLLLVRHRVMGFGPALGLLTAFNLVLGLSVLALLVRRVEERDRVLQNEETIRRMRMEGLEKQTSALQQEVANRVQELETASANLRIANKVNALLALCAQHMPSSVIITDAGGQVLWANQSWEQLSGWNQTDSARQQADELLGRFWSGFDPAQGREIFAAGQPTSFEARGSTADGQILWLAIAFQPVRNPAEQVVNFILVIDDITADRQMWETLHVAEERLKLALLATNESVWDWDIPTGHIYRDQRWSELVGEETNGAGSPAVNSATEFTSGGLEPFVLAGISEWSDRVHPDDLPAAQAALEAHLQNRTPVYMSEHRLRTQSGQWIWTLDRGKVVSRDEGGRPLRMVGTQGDITARKKLEERLRQNEEMSIQVSRLAQIGAWELLAENRELRWEPELYRIAEVELGYSPTLAKMAEFFSPEDRVSLNRAIDQALNDGRSFDLECPFVTGLGRRRWVHVFGRAEFKEGRAVRLFGAVQVVSAAHVAEEAQRKLETQLFQVQKLETLGTLAGGIAHDFNNLLTGIIGFQELALDTLASDHPSRACLIEARNASRRACELVEQILIFGRQTGNSTHAPVDLAFLIEEARRFLRATIPVTVQIEVSITPHCGRVLADPTQLSQVLLNLSTNAAHAMRHGSGVLSIVLGPTELNAAQASAHGDLPPGDYVRLSVVDTGHGMDDQTKKRIFDPFFTTKATGEGTGLGLAIVHGIVRAHSGAIEVESTPEVGTSFHLYLPVVAEESETVEAPAAPLNRGNGEVICVVDDEQLVAQATRLTLERFGYRPVVFGGADECLKALRQAPDGCSLVLSDQTMPGLTGMELAAEVRTFAPTLPIIIMSGYFSKVSPDALEKIGYISLLAKPFTAPSLTQAVHRSLYPDGAAATPVKDPPSN